MHDSPGDTSLLLAVTLYYLYAPSHLGLPGQIRRSTNQGVPCSQAEVAREQR